MWLPLVAASTLFSVGSVLFGKFESGVPAWRRLLKLGIFLILVAALARFAGPDAAWSFLALATLGGLSVHFTWCRRHQIDPWRAEPWNRYSALRGWTR